MNSKLQSQISAIIAAVSGFIAWLSTVPPEQQSGMLAQFVDMLPIAWRPTIGLYAKLLMTLSAFYATYHASKSGPTPPPKT